MVKAYLKYV
jgi:U3 small nucleolar RNA-associated protein 12